MGIFDLVNPADWPPGPHLSPEAHIRLHILDQDIQSVQIAYADMLSANEQKAPPQIFHHAKTFTCAVRRAWRVLEHLNAGGMFPIEVSKAIKLEINKKRSTLEPYVEPRNAIEHIDSEDFEDESSNFRALNITREGLEVRAGVVAPLNADPVTALINTRAEILAAVNAIV